MSHHQSDAPACRQDVVFADRIFRPSRQQLAWDAPVYHSRVTEVDKRGLWVHDGCKPGDVGWQRGVSREPSRQQLIHCMSCSVHSVQRHCVHLRYRQGR
jgi:hypothetical protein